MSQPHGNRRRIGWIAGASGSLFVVIFVGSVFSFLHETTVAWPRGRDSSFLVVQTRAALIVGACDRDADSVARNTPIGGGDVWGTVWYYFIGDRLSKEWGFAGFSYTELSDPFFAGRVSWAYTIPYWPLLVATAVMPYLRLRSALAMRQRAAMGSCPRCGYDLRATPDRCPECGMAPDSSMAQ